VSAVALLLLNLAMLHIALFLTNCHGLLPVGVVFVLFKSICVVSVQSFCLGDWLKITEEGPWLFRQNAVIIEKYDGLAAPESIDLNFVAVWMQIHKLPPGYRKKNLITNLTEKKVGKVLQVETEIEGVNNFVRVRVKLDVRKPLARFVTIVIVREGKREFYAIKFEKMPRFCGACGFLGHTHLECGSGEHDENNLKWGDWLKADWESWYGRNTGGSRGRGRGGRGRTNVTDENLGRGRGFGDRGRGPYVSWRFNALSHAQGLAGEEGEFEDTGTSPIKNSNMETDERETSDNSVKRHLELGTSNSEDEYANLSIPHEEMTPMITNGPTSEVPMTEGDTGRIKRSKKAGAVSPSTGSAGSFEEPVRSQ
jgi:hypothetical protein